MTHDPRYAIYFVPPPESALYRLGAALLGYDAFTGAALPRPAGILKAVPDWNDLTREPQVYGFHATLKAPMSLAQNKNEDELRAACEALAGTIRAIPVIEPTLSVISDFIAIIPAIPSPELDRLAEECVSALDAFRAPLTGADRARRNPAALTERQIKSLDRWGYPYVMEDFRFHMTLTSRLPAGRQAPVLAILREHFAALSLKTLAISQIALCRQDAKGPPFRILSHWALRDR